MSSFCGAKGGSPPTCAGRPQTTATGCGHQAGRAAPTPSDRIAGDYAGSFGGTKQGKQPTRVMCCGIIVFGNGTKSWVQALRCKVGLWARQVAEPPNSCILQLDPPTCKLPLWLHLVCEMLTVCRLGRCPLHPSPYIPTPYTRLLISSPGSSAMIINNTNHATLPRDGPLSNPFHPTRFVP